MTYQTLEEVPLEEKWRFACRALKISAAEFRRRANKSNYEPGRKKALDDLDLYQKQVENHIDNLIVANGIHHADRKKEIGKLLNGLVRYSIELVYHKK